MHLATEVEDFAPQNYKASLKEKNRELKTCKNIPVLWKI